MRVIIEPDNNPNDNKKEKKSLEVETRNFDKTVFKQSMHKKQLLSTSDFCLTDKPCWEGVSDPGL